MRERGDNKEQTRSTDMEKTSRRIWGNKENKEGTRNTCKETKRTNRETRIKQGATKEINMKNATKQQGETRIKEGTHKNTSRRTQGANKENMEKHRYTMSKQGETRKHNEHIWKLQPIKQP